MRRRLSTTCLTVFLVTSVLSYNANRKNTCSYYENPNLIPFLTNRIRDEYSDDGIPNLRVFFNGADPEEDDDLMRRFNFGYLNLDHPLSSLDELFQMNSEEIGQPPFPEPKVKPKLWNVDEVQKLAAPRVLPDVGLALANSEQDVHLVQPQPQVLDEHELELGRKLVDETPTFPDVMGVEKSLTQEVKDMDRAEIGESYLRSPEYYYQGPSVVLNSVVQRREPDFMDQLKHIKMSALNVLRREDIDDRSKIHERPIDVMNSLETSEEQLESADKRADLQKQPEEVVTANKKAELIHKKRDEVVLAHKKVELPQEQSVIGTLLVEEIASEDKPATVAIENNVNSRDNDIEVKEKPQIETTTTRPPIEHTTEKTSNASITEETKDTVKFRITKSGEKAHDSSRKSVSRRRKSTDKDSDMLREEKIGNKPEDPGISVKPVAQSIESGKPKHNVLDDILSGL